MIYDTEGLTVDEIKWLKRLERTLKAAPKSLRRKVRAYTIGDNDITIFDAKKWDDGDGDELLNKGGCGNNDVCTVVDELDAEIGRLWFPFAIESTAG